VALVNQETVIANLAAQVLKAVQGVVLALILTLAEMLT
jgi:hypothetical protein